MPVDIQETVVFSAVIGVDGLVKQVDLISGHLLVGAARDAVSKRGYKPTLLNGEPVEVATTFAVSFTPLHSKQ